MHCGFVYWRSLFTLFCVITQEVSHRSTTVAPGTGGGLPRSLRRERLFSCDHVFKKLDSVCKNGHLLSFQCHFRHIISNITFGAVYRHTLFFFSAISRIFDVASNPTSWTRWSEPSLAAAQANGRLQSFYWPLWWEFWLLADRPRTVDVRTACREAKELWGLLIKSFPVVPQWANMWLRRLSHEKTWLTRSEIQEIILLFFSWRRCEQHWQLIW